MGGIEERLEQATLYVNGCPPPGVDPSTLDGLSATTIDALNVNSEGLEVCISPRKILGFTAEGRVIYHGVNYVSSMPEQWMHATIDQYNVQGPRSQEIGRRLQKELHNWRIRVQYS